MLYFLKALGTMMSKMICCQQLGGCVDCWVSVGDVYNLLGMYITCWVSLGPTGPGYRGLYVSWCLTLVLYIACQQLGG